MSYVKEVTLAGPCLSLASTRLDPTHFIRYTSHLFVVFRFSFVPANEASLQAMFDAMSKCQSLHPDPADSNDEDEEVEGEEEEGMYDDAEEEGDGEGAEEDDGDGRPSNGGGGTEEPMDQ